MGLMCRSVRIKLSLRETLVSRKVSSSADQNAVNLIVSDCMRIESTLILSALDRAHTKVDCKWVVSGLSQSTAGRWIKEDRCNYQWVGRTSRDITGLPPGNSLK